MTNIKTLYTQKTLQSACHKILSKEVVSAMLTARIALPELVKLAALNCLVEQDEFENKTNFEWCLAQSIIKSALTDLNIDGMFHFEEL